MVRYLAYGCSHRPHRRAREIEYLEIVAVSHLVPERSVAGQPRRIRRHSAITVGEVHEVALGRLGINVRAW